MLKNSVLFFLSFLFLLPALQAQTVQTDYVDGRMYVKLHNYLHQQLPEFSGAENSKMLVEDYPELFAIATQYGIYEVRKAFKTRSEDLDNTYEFRFADMTAVDMMVRDISGLSYIDYAEKVPLPYPSFSPNDYNSFQDYHLNKIQALAAWDISTGDTNVVIAIVDDAVNIDHEDLVDNIWINRNEIPGNSIDDDGNGYVDDVYGWDASDNDPDPRPHPTATDCNVFGLYPFCHGTSVAGAASASTNNGKGVASIGFNCRIMAVKARSNTNLAGGIDGGWAGVDYAIQSGANVINMSWGGNGSSATNQNLINAGYNMGVVFVGGAGNDGVSALFYPASYNNVISVGATNSNDVKASWSNYNNMIDVMAPGVQIRTTAAANPSYVNIDGTSFSGPIVSGLCALMLAANPCLSPADLEMYLKSTCDNIDAQNPSFVGQIGAGRVNAAAALSAVSPSNSPQANFSIVNSNSCGGAVQFLYSTTDPLLGCPTNYFWSFGNGQISTQQNPLTSYSASGTYSVTLTVNNSIGTNSVTTNVPVTVLPVPNVAAGPDITTCFGEVIQLNGSTDLSGTFSWTPNADLSNPNIANPVLTANASRTYFMTVTTPDGCSNTDTLKVTVLPTPTVWAGLDKTINPGDSAALGALGAVTYEWSPTIGLSNPNIASPKASPPQTITYTVRGYNNEGCWKEDDVRVKVNGTWHVGIDDVFLASAGIVNPAFPNPAGDHVIFSADLNLGGDLQISLLDLAGKRIETIWSGRVPGGEFSQNWLRPTDIPAGIYLAVWEMNGARFPQKIQLR